MRIYYYNYLITTQKTTTKTDFLMFSVIFPGQGSQSVGMVNDLYKKFDVKFSMLLSALVAAENIQYMANKISINKPSLTRAVQSYLK